MQVGDKITFIPSAFEVEKSGKPPDRWQKPLQVVGRVIFIHPQRRYFTVEAEVNGRTIRESLYFKK